MVLGGALGPGLGGRDAAAFCVAGVALGDIHFRFAWQAWHKLTSTVVLRGRRGTYGTGWRPWARFRRAWCRGILRGRRGTWWHSLSFRVAGVAQTHIYRRFAWQAWHLWYWVAPLAGVAQSYIHIVLHGHGQVLFRSCIVIGPVTSAAVFIVHQLESSTNSPRFVPWQLELTCFDIGLAQWFGAMCKEPCSLTLQECDQVSMLKRD